MTISKDAVIDFMNRPRESFNWVKRYSRADLVEELSELGVPMRWKTRPRLHQLACYLVGILNPKFLMLLDMGLGKALSHDEPVMTPTGPRPIGGLVVGDFVIGSDGRPTRVTGVFPQGLKEVYQVIFSDDSTVECCNEHLWRVKTPAMHSWKTLELQQFKDDLRYEASPGRDVGNLKWFVPMSAPVQFASQSPLTFSPYVLGVLLGDGSLSSGACMITINANDQDIVSRVARLLPEGITLSDMTEADPSCVNKGLVGRGGWLRKWIKERGLNVTSHFKTVPHEYLYASIEDRKELLAGLLDTDGYATPHGAFSFAVTSKALADAVQFLTRTLGGAAIMRTSTNEFGDVFEVYGRTPFNPFTTKRKADVYALRKLEPTRAIKEVTLAGIKECVCISVAAKDGLFLTRDMVVTHNTLLVLMLLIAAKAKEGEDVKALVVVPKKVHMGTWIEQVSEHTDLSIETVDAVSIVTKWETLMSSTADVTVIDYAGLTLACTGKKYVDGKNKMTRDDKRVMQLRRKYKFLVLDEVHRVKNKESVRFGIFRQMVKDMLNVYGLTGTPQGRDPQDLWGQFFLIDGGETLGESIGLFREGFFIAKNGYFGGHEYKFDTKKQDLLSRFIQNASLVYDEKECLDLPPVIPIKRNFILSPAQRDEYNHLRQGDEIDGVRVPIDGVYHRMREVTSGYTRETVNGISVTTHFTENPKLDLFEEDLLEMPPSRKGIVFYDYIPTGLMLSTLMKSHKIKHLILDGRTKDPIAIEKQFREDPKVQILLCNSASGSEGINAQAANYQFFYESPVSPITRRQAMKRAHRQGQERRVIITDYVAKHTVDETILRYIAEGFNLLEALKHGSKDARRALFAKPSKT